MAQDGSDCAVDDAAVDESAGSAGGFATAGFATACAAERLPPNDAGIAVDRDRGGPERGIREAVLSVWRSVPDTGRSD